MIDIKKSYVTTEHQAAVRFYSEDGTSDFPVHGAVKDFADGWISTAWDKDGRNVTAIMWDLIEVKPSEIEEMIAWLEKQIEVDHADTYSGAALVDALTEARRIRDSNATSDE